NPFLTSSVTWSSEPEIHAFWARQLYKRRPGANPDTNDQNFRFAPVDIDAVCRCPDNASIPASALIVHRNNPSASRLLAVIPAYNEAATVAAVVRGVISTLDCDVLVVSDASDDDTAALARAAGARVIELAWRLGAWGATQTGMRYAGRKRYTHVLTLDADGQHHPQELPRLLAEQQRSDADVTIGTCTQRLSVAKRLAWRYFRLLTGIGVQDFTSGLRVYNRRAIAVLASPEASLLDYQDLGVLMLLRKKGLCLRELPTLMSPRCTGGSRVFSSWRMVARYMMHTTVLCFAQIGAASAPGEPDRAGARA
ncbi:MAG TPA: glycosyltransferase family 2 protein, partial [Rudaea sp.]|nr:glycosyltransferase family 2 protein [Rudaea sp.]